MKFVTGSLFSLEDASEVSDKQEEVQWYEDLALCLLSSLRANYGNAVRFPQHVHILLTIGFVI